MADPGRNRKAGGRWLLGGLLAMMLVVGLGAFVARDNLFRYLIEPTIPFQVAEQPPAPDYADAAAWSARPQGRAASASDRLAVFFVHPTTAYQAARGWNVSIQDRESRARLEDEVLANHAGPFAEGGDLWAPRYRQATLFAMLASRSDTHDALDFAYGDVARAFRAFQAERGADAPYVLVGVGQGGLHVLRLLQSAVVGTPAQSGLVAAYVLEQTVDAALVAPDGPLATIGPCGRRQQSGCLISFVTVDDNDARGRRLVTQRSLTWRPDDGYFRVVGQPLVCINPLTGGAAASAPAAANRGAAAASGLDAGLEPALLPGETGATCEDGMLLVDPSRPEALMPPRFELGTRYKPARYNLFYQALRQDMATRAQVFVATEAP